MLYIKTFHCENCGCKNFIKEHTFSVEFRNVNFTDDLIFTEVPEVAYACRDCGERYSQEDMKTSLKNMIKAYKDNISCQ